MTRSPDEPTPSPAEALRLVREAYEQRVQALRALGTQLEADEARLSTLRGLTLLAALVAGVAGGTRGSTPLWAASALAALAFVVLVVRHGRVIDRREDTERRLAWVTRRLATSRDEAPRGSAIGAPPEAPEPSHPFAVDLDVVGPASLLERLSVGETRYGREQLAAWLLAHGSNVPSVPELSSRQGAVRVLASERALREDLAALAARLRRPLPERERLTAWASEVSLAEPRVRALLALRYLSPFTVLAFALAQASVVTWHAWALPLAVQSVVSALLRAPLAQVFAVAERGEESLGRLAPLFARLEAARLDHPRLGALVDRLRAGEGASRALGSLASLLAWAELRRSVAHVFIDAALLWDAWVGSSLERWRVRHGALLPDQCEALGELEALSALATFAHDAPDHSFPEVTDAAPHVEAVGLGHPLLPRAGRVTNDVTLAGPGQGLLVTGSNMSGKSTLLRALGANVTLALAGSVVCAERLSIHRASVWTSMRVRDSLAQGVSHFYAEILRLRVVLDAAERGEPVLFLLDEVLHGTNSRERIVGAKAVVRRLLELGAMGVVTSHDLGLAELAHETHGAVALGHFREHVEGETMTFDYRLRQGVVPTQNALRLMRGLGLPVPLEAE